MNNIGTFIHLYHVWGLFGLLTALIYGRAAVRRWRQQGGLFRTAPTEWSLLIWYHAGMLVRDLKTVGRAAAARFVGADHLWPSDPRSPWRYESEQSLLFGIMLGGLARFLTAFYWGEYNTAWMTDTAVLVPAIPVAIAVIADLSHQSTAWSTKKHRVRLLGLAALLWVILGGFIRG